MEVIRLRTLALVGAFVLAGFSLGCEKDQGNNGQIIPSSDTGSSDAGDTDDLDGEDMDAEDTTAEDGGDTSEGDTEDPDAGDTGDSGDGGPATCSVDDDCEDGQLCLDDACVEVNPDNKCQAAEDLGTLQDGQTVTITDSFLTGTDALQTSCAEPGIETVYKFTVAEDSLVSFETDWQAQFDARLEFRVDCQQQSSVAQCFDNDQSVFLPAGQDYWLVVEQDVGRGGDFTIDLTASADECPLGQRGCTTGTLEVCTGSGGSESFDCATDACADASTCTGDTCGSAIDVTASTTFSGDITAYQNNFDFDGASLCRTDNGDNLPTPGREVVFRLPNLTQGQTVYIDAKTNDSNLNAIFVMRDCTITPYQCDQVLVDSEQGEFSAPADGTYFVVIDKLTTGSSTFEYSIEYR